MMTMNKGYDQKRIFLADTSGGALDFCGIKIFDVRPILSFYDAACFIACETQKFHHKLHLNEVKR